MLLLRHGTLRCSPPRHMLWAVVCVVVPSYRRVEMISLPLLGLEVLFLGTGCAYIGPLQAVR
jgi:hypothetical protein